MNTLTRCFKGTKETPPRLIKVKPNLEKAQGHIAKAEYNLGVTDLMLENKKSDWMIICSYYAMYHATMASLWLLGLEARPHECAISAFNAFYVKKGVVEKEFVSYLEKAKKMSKALSDTLEDVWIERIKAQYGLGEIRSQQATKAQNEAKLFVEEVRKLVFEARNIEEHYI